ncbi:neuroglobin [Aplysia californica]|uniref:Globin n=1 Tax=Aplysia californica TaxID=6500 RepID=A0ABM0JRG4_APLCA|nr:neuroglobin [Aplysia californica]
MGCSSSSNKQEDECGHQVDYFLSPDEIRIVRESWAVVALDLPATGLHIFTRLFEMEKDLKKLFRRLMSQTESGEFIFDTIRLEHHATLVMKNLGQAVDNLDDSEVFSEMLVLLGEKHSSYNVRPAMLAFLWPAIRDGLKMRLGDKFTVETELAWKHLYDYISCKMSDGMSGRHKNSKKILFK